MINPDVRAKIEARLRRISREKFDALAPQKRIALVMYFADTGLTAADVAPFVNLNVSQVKAIMEASV